MAYVMWRVSSLGSILILDSSVFIHFRGWGYIDLGALHGTH